MPTWIIALIIAMSSMQTVDCRGQLTPYQPIPSVVVRGETYGGYTCLYIEPVELELYPNNGIYTYR